MRILYVTWHWPGAPAYGAQQRTIQIGRLLQKVGEVSLVVVNVDADGERWRANTEKTFDIARVVNVRPVSSSGLINRLRHEFDPRYLPPTGVDSRDRDAVLASFQEYDIAWLHQLRSADLLRIYRWPRSVMDVDDIHSRLYDSQAQIAISGVRTLLDRRMSLIWRRRERKLSERFTVLTVSSEEDRKYLGLPKTRVLPNGFERLHSVERHVPPEQPILGFIGTFRWMPNVEGTKWFCSEVWPSIRRRVPGVRLRLVGEGTEVARDLGEAVEGLGRVADVGPEIATWVAMVVPIRVGGGTRIKVLEGFARKCPVVATTLGAFGYGLEDGRELFVADEPDLFASRCVELLQSPQRAQAMADRGHRRFLESWTWESYAPIVQAAVEEALNSTNG